MTSRAANDHMLEGQETLSSAVSQTSGVIGDRRCTTGALTPADVSQVGRAPHRPEFQSLGQSDQQAFLLPRVYAENWLPFSYIPYYLPCPVIL